MVFSTFSSLVILHIRFIKSFPRQHGNRKAFIWGRSYLKYVYCEYNICNYNIWIGETCQIFLLNICIWQTRKSLPQMSQTKLEGKVHTKVLMPSSTSLVLLKKVLLNWPVFSKCFISIPLQNVRKPHGFLMLSGVIEKNILRANGLMLLGCLYYRPQTVIFPMRYI